MKTITSLYEQTISTGNLFRAWKEFRRGKASKRDVMRFEYQLEQNIFELHRDLKGKKYRHGPYKGFWIYDPKLRRIHKATVRDRVLHHAVFYFLNRVFEPTFISDSYSCRIGKGTHKGVLRMEKMLRKSSRNYTHPCYALKCDIKKFFDSVDHTVLLSLIDRKIKDADAICLMKEIVGSYDSETNILTRERERERE